MNNSSLPTLIGPRVLLRRPTPQDWAGRYALGNSPELHRMFGGDVSQFRELTEDAAKSWVDSHLKDRFAWVVETEGRLIGSVRLRSVNYADHRAVLSIGILDEQSHGKGYGVESIKLVARHAFGPMGLHRISLRVLAFNTRAIAAYRKVGFVEEGRERESAFIDGAWYDDVLMGLLAEDLTERAVA